MDKIYIALILGGSIAIVIGMLCSGVLYSDTSTPNVTKAPTNATNATKAPIKEVDKQDVKTKSNDTLNQIHITHHNKTIFKTFSKGGRIYLKIGLPGKTIELNIKG